jgi:hypothetical protein
MNLRRVFIMSKKSEHDTPNEKLKDLEDLSKIELYEKVLKLKFLLDNAFGLIDQLEIMRYFLMRFQEPITEEQFFNAIAHYLELNKLLGDDTEEIFENILEEDEG